MLRNISEHVDFLIRKSAIGENLTRIRKISPGFYKQLRQIYSYLFKFKSTHDLARYQIRSVRRFMKFVPMKNISKSVLEVGSDLDAKVIREIHELGCPQVTGVNPGFSEDDLARYNSVLPDGCILKPVDMRDTGFPDESFGAIFSVSVFEHLLDFKVCLAEMHRILEPGGMIYAEFGPIWSSSLGHHVYANAGKEQARHWDPTLNPLDDHSHLLLTKDEMSQFLSDKVSLGLRDAILHWVYDSEDINRFFYEDYLRILDASPFEVIMMEKDREFVAEELMLSLRTAYPDYTIFNIRNVELVLRKSD